MKRFCQPNLPHNKTNSVIMSGEYSFLCNELEKLNIKVIKVNPCMDLPYYERYHADLQMSYYKEGVLAVCRNQIQNIETDNLKIEICSAIAKTYPHNIAFNHIIMGNCFIGNFEHTDNRIKSYCMQNKFKIINVRQGYTKCSCAVVNENAIITADNGIYRKCREQRIDVLKIHYGYIQLYGYNYGFIGGCCGKLSEDIMAFSGTLQSHTDSSAIKSFLRNYSIYPLQLSNKPLFDVGSILPITEVL